MRILNERGRIWTVWEVVPEPVRASGVPVFDPDYVSGWLVFQSDQEKRRFAPPPPGWVDLTDRDLAVLLKHSVPVSTSRGSA
jgi:hypothetical protein